MTEPEVATAAPHRNPKLTYTRSQTFFCDRDGREWELYDVVPSAIEVGFDRAVTPSATAMLRIFLDSASEARAYMFDEAEHRHYYRAEGLDDERAQKQLDNATLLGIPPVKVGDIRRLLRSTR
jgi:hypothetical protein